MDKKLMGSIAQQSFKPIEQLRGKGNIQFIKQMEPKGQGRASSQLGLGPAPNMAAPQLPIKKIGIQQQQQQKGAVNTKFAQQIKGAQQNLIQQQQQKGAMNTKSPQQIKGPQQNSTQMQGKGAQLQK